jgi:hypothetical protein
MRIPLFILGVLVAGGLAANPILAEEFAYPKKGQSEAQQHQDHRNCSAWASQQSGHTPSAAASPAEQNRMSPGSGRGMMRGRMMGEAEGNSEGGMMGGGGAGMLRRKLMEKRAEEQPEQSDSGGDAAYTRAFKACMEGRGYSVE